MTADEILRIPLASPHLLFSGPAEEAKYEFRKLRDLWHPDRSHRPDVFAHVEALHAERTKLLASGLWPGRGEAFVRLKDGKTLVVRYLRRRRFEIGTMFVASQSVLFVIDEACRDLYENGLRRIRALSYRDAKLRDKMARLMPVVEREIETADGPGVVLAITPDVFLLRDVLDHCSGAMDPRHAAWVVTRLTEINTYLQTQGIVHNAISSETVFVSIEHHTALLLGGWWYAVTDGEPLIALPGHAHALWETSVPMAARKAKLADRRLDRELAREVGREAHGDAGGTALSRDPAVIPTSIREWLLAPGHANAFEDLRSWARARDQGYERKFLKWPLTAAEVYPAGPPGPIGP
jgi:hypothetical protein